MKTLLRGILAGLCIGIGGTVSLSVNGGIPGALFFTVGLFVILTMDFDLYTGKVCYVFENDRSYAARLLLILLGNIIGTALMAGLMHLTRANDTLTKAASALWETKLNDSPLSLFVLSILCNILIYVAVDGFKKNPHELGKYLSVFFGVMVFILAGFEHSVADAFYLFMGNVFSLKSALYLSLIVLGNAVGGVSIPLLRKWIHRLSIS